MTYTYKTRGTCARVINIELNGDTVENVEFVGGCSGNTQGIASLVKGMKAADVIEKCAGIRCGFKGTSCPDQLARALNEALEK